MLADCDRDAAGADRLAARHMCVADDEKIGTRLVGHEIGRIAWRGSRFGRVVVAGDRRLLLVGHGDAVGNQPVGGLEHHRRAPVASALPAHDPEGRRMRPLDIDKAHGISEIS